MECKFPQEETDDIKQNIQSILIDFFVQDANYASLKEKIYYQNALDYQIFIQLTAGMDNTMKNTYLVFKEYGSGQKFAIIPWDCNATWGAHYKSFYNPDYIEDKSIWSAQFYRLYEVDEKRCFQDLNSEWKLLRKKIITTENVSSIAKSKIDYLYVTGGYERNYQRWPFLPQEDENRKFFKTEWDDDYILSFIEKRIPFLDSYYDDMCTK